MPPWSVSLCPSWVTRRVVITVALALLGVLGMLLVSVLEGARAIVAGDAHYVLAAAQSLAYDGDLDLTNQYLAVGDRWGLGRDPTTDGWRLPARELGASILMLPGLWLHHLLRLPADWEPACACALGAASLGPCWLGCARVIEVALRGRGTAWHGDLLAGAAVLGFVVPYYAIGSPGYSHAPDAAIGAWLCWALLDRRGPVLIGVLLACAVLTRMQNVLWLLWPACEWVLRPSESGRRDSLVRLLTLCAIGLLGFAPQLWLGLAHPGSVRGALGWTWGFFNLDDLAADLVRVLVGVHGLVSWTPIAGLALLGLLLRTRGAHQTKLGPLAVLMGMWLLLATVRDVDGGDAFGARRTAGLVGVLALGLAQLWTRLDQSAHRRVLMLVWVVTLTLAVAANLARTQQAIVGELSLTSPDRSPGHR
jgi:hypothetical protein